MTNTRKPDTITNHDKKENNLNTPLIEEAPELTAEELRALPLVERFHELEHRVTNEVLERSQEVHTATLSLLARCHHFQVGSPGVGKSYLVGRLVKRIEGFGDDGYFHWLLTQYTTPEELFGGPDFNKLREEGKYKRITDNKAPRAYVWFYDEIFKGNSAILNANLTAINERLYFNDDDEPHIPLISLFGASNEMPSSEELGAMYDRLHFRHEVHGMKESSSFVEMLTKTIEADPAFVVSVEDILTSHAFVDAVEINDEILNTIKTLRDQLGAENVSPTDRRWMECIKIIKAEAFYNGREVADIEDLRPLMHVLWDSIDQQKIVKSIVLGLCSPIDKEANEILDRLLVLESEFRADIKDADNAHQIARKAIEVQQKLTKAKKKIKALKQQVAELEKESPVLNEAEAKFKEVGVLLLTEGFQIDKDDLEETLSKLV